jgi:hypothetical protein
MDSLLGNGYGYDLATTRMLELQREADRVHMVSAALGERRRIARRRSEECSPAIRRRLVDIPAALLHSLMS